MDCEASFSSLLGKLGLEPGVQEALKSRKFVTAADFYWALQEKAEDTFQAVLSEAQVDAGPSVLQSIQAGRLRRLLHECKKLCAEDNVAPAAGGGEATTTHPSSLLGLAIGPRLSGDAMQKLWSEFGANYPAEVVEGEARPCKVLIQTIFAQKSNKELKFIPWKNIISEPQFDRAKQSVTKKDKCFLDIIADAAGQTDSPDIDPSPSPFAVQRLLLLRSTAWALVGWCHLACAKKLAHRFVELYAPTGLASLGLRPPTLAEAEAVDAEICRTLNLLLSSGFSLDQALHELIEVRCSLNVWLQPRPKVNVPDAFKPLIKKPKLPQPLPYKRPPKTDKKHCFRFQAGKCKMADCKFLHQCEKCDSSQHACPELGKH